MITYVAIWLALGLVVLGLAIYRRTIAGQADGLVHLVAGEENLPAIQTEVAHKLEVVDRWGKSLTVLLIVYGLAIAFVVARQVWEAGQTAGM